MIDYDCQYTAARREVHALIERARLQSGQWQGPRRAIYGGSLHGMETCAPSIGMGEYRLHAIAGSEVWIPKGVPAGEEVTYIARARILGERA